MATIQQRADKIARRSRDAYSFDGYGFTSWRACATMLLRRGASDHEAECVLRSKWTRWAGDVSSHRYGRYTSADLARFLDDPHDRKTLDRIKELATGF